MIKKKKSTYKKPTGNIIPNGDTPKAFTLTSAPRLGCPAITTSIHHCTGCPSQQSKTRKINKDIRIIKKETNCYLQMMTYTQKKRIYKQITELMRV